MTIDEARAVLETHGQSHVLRFWDTLDAGQRARLLAQIDTLDFKAIGSMQARLKAARRPTAPLTIEPAAVIAARAAADDIEARGRQQLAAGKVGVILVAGGQGSRLGYEGPKGCYAIGPVSGASLFEIHARKILALERRCGADVPFYIMTSAANDDATRAFFDANAYFGLDRSRVRFFVQGMWPALWPDGRIVLDEPGHVFMSPDGHGGTLSALKDRGMLDDMRARGLETLFYFQVDNPLVEIADPAFVGRHLRTGADISVKVCAKRDPAEGLGVVAHANGHDLIVEYTELTDAQKTERMPDGSLRFQFGSVAIHLFTRAFLEQEAAAELPLHVAHKQVPFCDAQGTTVKPATPNAYKFEKFIFDVLPHARICTHVEFLREEEFSPVKNAVGSDSPATCRRDMMRKFARWLTAAGASVPVDADGTPRHRIEIDPCFALGPADLTGKLTGLAVDGDLLLTEDEESGCGNQ